MTQESTPKRSERGEGQFGHDCERIALDSFSRGFVDSILFPAFGGNLFWIGSDGYVSGVHEA